MCPVSSHAQLVSAEPHGSMHVQVMDFLGSAAFSRAVQALDVKTRRLVCLKIIKNNKDYFDQSLDEIKLLSYINSADPMDEHGLLRLYDYFYYKVCPAASSEVCEKHLGFVTASGMLMQAVLYAARLLAMTFALHTMVLA